MLLRLSQCTRNVKSVRTLEISPIRHRCVLLLRQPTAIPSVGNGLKDLPTGIAALSSLRTLRLSDNSLTALPVELASLPLLTEVHLGGNSGLDAQKVADLLRRRPQMAIVWDSTGDGAERTEADPTATATR